MSLHDVRSLAGLCLEERIRLERQFLTKKAGADRTARMPRRERDGPAPLSFAQQRLWFAHQLEPGPAYNMSRAFRLSGALNIPALEKALGAVVGRHEVLRTTFPCRDGVPVQVVGEAGPFALEVVNLRGRPDPEGEAQHLVGEEARRAFDLSWDPMLRARLLWLGGEEHVLSLVVHHIACDGWSLGVLMRELSAFYEAFAAGRRAPLPDLPVQYTDYALWQRGALRGEALDRQLAYWRERLAGAPPALELPADRPRPAVQTYRGGLRPVHVPPEAAEQLRALARQEKATPFMALLAVFQTLLSRYSRQDDVVVGTAVAGRTRRELEPLVGCFVNTLPLRADLSGDPTFRELLRQVRESSLGAFAHQDLPFERLVEELAPQRDPSRNPVVQAFFQVFNAPREDLRLAGLTVRPLQPQGATAKFDLSLTLSERAGGLRGMFIYNKDLFDAETIARLSDHFGLLLRSAAAAPDAPVSRLPLVTEPESRLLTEWNATQTAPPPRPCLHHLFEAQAERTPDAVAVVYGAQTLTYGELNRRAGLLAQHLRTLGVGPDTLVGICLERSADLPVGLLGILKAGGAYLPLDPAYPRDRLRFMLDDARVGVIVTQRRFLGALPEHSARAVCLDGDWDEIARQSRQGPPPAGAGHHLAYALYTSGSTGRPKGVLIEHHSAAAFVEWARGVFSREELAGVLAATSLCFDLSVFELFVPLSVGGRVLLADNALALPTLPGASSATLVNTVPSALAELLRSDGLPPSVRTINLAGEPLPRALAEQVYARPTVERLFNLYGPTECTTYSTWALVPWDVPGPPTIGRPIANTRVHVLDRHRQPVPVGVPGEVYIGGAGVARGYLNRPELTGERFVPDPFTEEPGARLYKTGDLARWLPSGELEYLGRLDDQVKVRGFRIELGEVEAVLAAHAAVREAVAVTRKDDSGEPRLVAYVVPRGGQELAVDELRAHLRDKLPEYMVPSAFVTLQALPLNPNGKVDRKALPAPAQWDALSEKESLAPRDSWEGQLALLWREVLQVKSVSIRDNFFSAGGHSLLAARLAFRIKEVFGQELPLVALFQAPTIEGLAGLLRQGAGSRPWPTLVPVQTRGSKRPLFCVARPNANPLGYAFLASRLGPEQPVYVLQRQARDLDVSPYSAPYSQEEYACMAAEYIQALRAVQPEGPYFLMGQCHGAHIAFEMARQFAEQGEKVPALVMLDAWPLENTRSYFLFHLAGHLRGLRAFLRRSPSEKLAALRGKARRLLAWALGRLLPRRRQATGQAQAPDPRKAWAQRVWPGKDFVPTTVPSRIVVFRVQKQFFWRPADPQLGWGNRTTGGVEVHLVPGDHRTMLREPHVGTLAEVLTESLARAEGR